MKEVIKFNIKAPFAFFSDKSGVEFNSSYSCITPTAIKGILGAILGLEGFKDFSKNKGIDYLRELNHLHIGIEINNEKITQTPIKYSDNTLMNITNVNNRPTLVGYSVLNKVDYNIYIVLDSDLEIDIKIKDFLINGKSYYPIYLGKNEFSASISNIELERYTELNDNNLYIDSIFPKLFSKYSKVSENFYKRRTRKNDFKEVFATKMFFSIPISSDFNTGEYNRFEKVTFNAPATDINLDNDKIIEFKNKNIYVF